MWTEPAPPASVPASTAMMAAEFADRPFGSHGELLLPPTPGSTNVEPGVPLRIEPWPEEERRRAAEPEPAHNEISALDRMRIADHTDDDWPVFGPPVPPAPPLLPVAIPAWSEEERRRDQLERERVEAASRARQEPAVAEELPGSRPPWREAP
jgi:hypothetical protein